ncbi:MAG: HD-GYP domain-containing protein (c-di-GMP phosphodiesterase class II) [Pseudohongiellaceae bacterium]|jgi:HD-GYP domain-containing protein (c-di-GMP phosphodiesterase class II)
MGFTVMDRYMRSQGMNQDNEQQDYYVCHLAEVNKTNRVLTTSDIKNNEGALIVAKGTPITTEISKKIIKHKLLKPLESCVTLEHSVTPDNLIDELNQIIEGQENKQVLQQKSLIDLLHESCDALSNYPLLVQKFTVMQSRFPRLYKKTMGSSFIALIVAWQMELTNKERQHIFIAALMRDIGLLHIEPSLVKNRGKLAPDEWRTLQGHVVIGKIFLDFVPDLPKSVGRAVLEHHERRDGSGYPYGKLGDKLCTEGQVLAMADTVSGIYEKQVVNRSYTLAAVIPILQINMQLYPMPIYKATLATITYMAGPLHRFYPDNKIPELCASNIQRINQLALWKKNADPLTRKCIAILPESKTLVLLAIATRVHRVVDTSGLFTQANVRWLQSVADNAQTELYEEVEQQLLMIDELEWHFRQWDARLTTCSENESVEDDGGEVSYIKLNGMLHKNDEVLSVA